MHVQYHHSQAGLCAPDVNTAADHQKVAAVHVAWQLT